MPGTVWFWVSWAVRWALALVFSVPLAVVLALGWAGVVLVGQRAPPVDGLALAMPALRSGEPRPSRMTLPAHGARHPAHHPPLGPRHRPPPQQPRGSPSRVSSGGAGLVGLVGAASTLALAQPTLPRWRTPSTPPTSPGQPPRPHPPPRPACAAAADRIPPSWPTSPASSAAQPCR